MAVDGLIFVDAGAESGTKSVSKGHSRPHEKRRTFGKLSELATLSKFPPSKTWKRTSTSRSLLVHFQFLESLENMRVLLQPLWGAQIATKKMDRSAKVS